MPPTTGSLESWCLDDGVGVEIAFEPWQTRPILTSHRTVNGGIKDVQHYAGSAENGGPSSLSATAFEPLSSEFSSVLLPYLLLSASFPSPPRVVTEANATPGRFVER